MYWVTASRITPPTDWPQAGGQLGERVGQLRRGAEGHGAHALHGLGEHLERHRGARHVEVARVEHRAHPARQVFTGVPTAVEEDGFGIDIDGELAHGRKHYLGSSLASSRVLGNVSRALFRLLSLVCVMVAAVAPAQEPDGGLSPPEQLRVRVTPEHAKLGEPVTLEIVVTHDPQQRYELKTPSDLGDFDYLGQERKRVDGADRSRPPPSRCSCPPSSWAASTRPTSSWR